MLQAAAGLRHSNISHLRHSHARGAGNGRGSDGLEGGRVGGGIGHAGDSKLDDGDRDGGRALASAASRAQDAVAVSVGRAGSREGQRVEVGRNVVWRQRRIVGGEIRIDVGENNLARDGVEG